MCIVSIALRRTCTSTVCSVYGNSTTVEYSRSGHGIGGACAPCLTFVVVVSPVKTGGKQHSRAGFRVRPTDPTSPVMAGASHCQGEFMLVRVFHTSDLSSGYDTDGLGTGQREVFAYTLPDPAVGTTVDHGATLDHIFMLFNVGDDPAFGEPEPLAVAYRVCRLRSLSVGDVVALDETYFACASVGWRRLDVPPVVDGPGSSAGADLNAPH
jgi:hypothetical protein